MTTESEKTNSLFIENRAALLERTLRIIHDAQEREVINIHYQDARGNIRYLGIPICKLKAIAGRFEQDLIAVGCTVRARRIKEKFQGDRKL